MKTIKITRKTTIAIEKLHSLIEKMEYYYYNTPAWREIQKDVNYIQEHLVELSTDKKVDRARLASKLKNLFLKENKELREEIKDLKEEIGELRDDREIEESEEQK